MARSSGKKRKRGPIALHCKECNSHNYTLIKKVKADYKLDDQPRFCKQCQAHTPHVEKKIAKNN